MATIGYLKLMFGADTGPLKKGTAEARSSIASVGASASKMGDLVGKAAAVAGVGLAAVGGAAILVAKNAAAGIDAIHDMAERIGTSTSALSALAHAAKLSGVESSLLESGLEKMEIKLAEVADTGKGPAKDALDKLGISIADLQNKDPIEAFHVLVNAIGKVEDPTKRAAAAVDLFGKSGQGLMGLAMQGADGLASLEAEADKLGEVVSELDAAKIGEMNDAFDRIGAAIDGVGAAIAVKMAPYITAVLDKTLELGLAARDMAGMFGEGLDYVSGLASQAGEALDSFGVNTANAWWLADEAVEAVGAGIDLVVDSVNIVEGAFINAAAAALDLGGSGLKVFNMLAGGVGAFVDSSLGYLQGFVGYLEDWLDFLTKPITDLLKALGYLPKAFTVNLITPVVEAGRAAANSGAVTGMTEGWIKELEASGDMLRKAADAQIADVGKGKSADMIRAAGAGIADAVKDSGIVDYLTKTIPEFYGGLAGDFMDSVDSVNGRAAEAAGQAEKTRGAGRGGAADLETGGKGGETKYAGALDVGSKEAYSAVLAAQGVGRGDGKDSKTTAKNTTSLVEEARAQTGLLKDMKGALASNGGGMIIDKLEAV